MAIDNLTSLTFFLMITDFANETVATAVLSWSKSIVPSA